MDRRTFLRAGTVGAVVLGTKPVSIPGQQPGLPPGFPRQELDLVERVVRFSHFDPDAVRELVGDRPELAKASWDWGFGDWETPLGAASHVGRREIAEYLLEHGARPNLFAFAMLGDVDAVRAALEARPVASRIRGPHGLTLLHHARAGGDDAVDVVAYLEERGDADPPSPEVALPGEGAVRYLGSYRIEGQGSETFDVVDRNGRLGVRFPEAAPRDLLHRGEGVFHPVGAPGVRLRFVVRGGRAREVRIEAGSSRWTASRVPA